MLTTVNQRWRERRDSYRPAGEPINVADYEVAAIADDTTARAFITQHHYSGTYPAARFRYGLYRGPELVGVAVYSHPTNDKTLTNVFHRPAREAVELGRLVLLDNVPANGETWFLSRCHQQLRQHVVGIVSFSDPVARTATDGRVIFGGHVGTIYQALNATFLGRGTARTLRLLPDGRCLSDRAIQKVRQQERGWRYVVEQLESYGVAPLADHEPAAWLKYWLPIVTRPLVHAGNLKYAWGLEKAIRKALPQSLPYVKMCQLRPSQAA